MPSCARYRSDPQTDFDDAYQKLVAGQLTECRHEANRGYARFLKSNPRSAVRFRILEARALLEQGLFDDAVRTAEGYASSSDAELSISATVVVAEAKINMHRLAEAEAALRRAEQQCDKSEIPSCGDVFQAVGILGDERSNSTAAEEYYNRSLSFARSHHDSFLESTSLLNLGNESLAQGRFDEAADRSQDAYDSARKIGANVIALVAQGNTGWASYRLGDSEKALELSLGAEKEARALNVIFDRENLLTNVGYIYMDQRKSDLAEQDFRQALELAQDIKAVHDVYNTLRVLARLALQTQEPDKADRYAERALQIARESGIHSDELYPMLVQGQVAAQRGDTVKAHQIFEAVEQDQTCPVFLKWEAQHSMARLYESQSILDRADREYRAALTTFELARSTVRREDFQISFLANGAALYDDYVRFLVTRHKDADALRWADFSRARTLAEGLGVAVDKPRRTSSDHNISSPPLNAQDVARRTNGLVLFYWLGEKQSYLWATTAKTMRLFELPPRANIEAAVERYRAALIGPQDVLASGNEDGLALYRMLIAPASELLRANAKVFIVPDGSLNNLNFETLIVPAAKPHYWIEDAEVVNASSLRLLGAAPAAESHRLHNLLLIGDSVSVSKDYPELPKAADQMASVSKHFAASQERVFQRAQATPAAYLKSNPEQFSNIHFVAHGTASRLSPLDSAIILSKDADDPNSFKLYARDVIHHPLKADLVTISACYGAGERQYSGEGLVGLAWAFLRAGSHNVIAALWDVADAPTDQLMDRFYEELAKGSRPDTALRAAKLSLLKNSPYRSPFYWAPFQLYVG